MADVKRTAALERRAALKTDPDKARTFEQRGRRSSARTLAQGTRRISPAHPDQRAKVRDCLCVNCGGPGPCDPAHLTPRSLGGCDSPDCVVGMCRGCHRAFDEGQLDLESVIALPRFSAERAHMAGHMSLRRCIHRLTGHREESL